MNIRQPTSAPSTYHCIGSDLHGYFIERIFADSMTWIVPGTYHDDPSYRGKPLSQLIAEWPR